MALRRTAITFAFTAIAGGVLQWLSIWSGFAFSGDGIGPEHELHWLSHLLAVPAAVALLIALYGVNALERDALGFIGRAAAALAAIGLLIDVLGGSLVGWAGGVQDVTAGGLYDVGHDVHSASFIGLPGLLLLGLVIAVRGGYLPRRGGWIPFLSIPPAAAAGVIIDALGGDGGTAAVLFIGSIGLQYIFWGIATLRRDAASPGRPGPANRRPC